MDWNLKLNAVNGVKESVPGESFSIIAKAKISLRDEATVA
jgi:hypothetical protein